MNEQRPFERGDVVLHARRPEWGEGVVAQATPIMHEGQTAQRLEIRFTNKGKVTVNTAVAQLTPRGIRKDLNSVPEPETKPMSRTQTPSSFTPSSTGQGWLGQLSKRSQNEFENELWQLPEALTDPFAGIAKRLEATLETFQYSTNPRSLMDWACSQTGLSDPMSKYTRHELELGFERFGVERERHLKSLVRQLKAKGELETAKEIRRWLKIPAAVSALDKAINQS